MSEFRHRGLRVVVDTIEEAEWYFDSHRIAPSTRDEVARALKLRPVTPDTISFGNVFARELEGWEVGYTVSREKAALVVTIVAVDLPGELESLLSYFKRAGVEALPGTVKALLEGRKRKDAV